MQVHVTIGNRRFTALMDSGSSTNFISCAAADRVGLKFTSRNGARAVVANGDRVACCGLARDVHVNIGTEMFTIDCYSMPLGSFDMILGVSFLKKLGPILWDFDDLSMVFWRHGRRVQWNGIGSNHWGHLPTGRIYSVHGDEPSLVTALPFTVGIQPSCHGSHANPAVSDEFPIHIAKELVHTLSDVQCFSKLKLLQAFHQVLFSSDTALPSRITHGEFEDNILPYGLPIASAVFHMSLQFPMGQALAMFHTDQSKSSILPCQFGATSSVPCFFSSVQGVFRMYQADASEQPPEIFYDALSSFQLKDFKGGRSVMYTNAGGG